jgi:hypothetical protein
MSSINALSANTKSVRSSTAVGNATYLCGCGYIYATQSSNDAENRKKLAMFRRLHTKTCAIAKEYDRELNAKSASGKFSERSHQDAPSISLIRKDEVKNTAALAAHMGVSELSDGFLGQGLAMLPIKGGSRFLKKGQPLPAPSS